MPRLHRLLALEQRNETGMLLFLRILFYRCTLETSCRLLLRESCPIGAVNLSDLDWYQGMSLPPYAKVDQKTSDILLQHLQEIIGPHS